VICDAGGRWVSSNVGGCRRRAGRSDARVRQESCTVSRGGVWSRRSWLRCCWSAGGRSLPGSSGVLQCGRRHRQRPRGGRCCRPMGDDVRFPGRRGMRGHHGPGARPAASAGRLILMVGGLAGLLVASSPEPAGGGGSVRHTFGTVVGLVALAAWPVAARPRGLRCRGAAAGRLGQRFCGIAWRPAVVRRETGHGRRTGGPGGAALGRDANAMAGASDPVLPPTYGSAARPVRY
jgi:hypothetical protein